MNKLKYIWFSYDGSCFSVAKKLIDEGNTVIVAQIQNASELHGDKKEEAEDKAKRLSLFNGIIQKHDAKKVLRMMAKLENKEEWFIVFDLNSLWYYAQAAVKLGFTQGFFPTEEDTLFEDDREKGKNLVKEFWPDLEVAEIHDFKTVEEGIQFLEDTEDMFVLKANTEGDLTVVPKGDDPEQAKQALMGALNTNKKEYEKEGYILELMIPNPIEVTPQMVFYNGEPIFTDIDIENKPLGAGSIGNMTGCASNLIIQTDMEEEINRIAFPPKVYEMAAKHPGLFIWDASLLIDSKTKKIYFGEFCPNRWGYDAIFTEIEMSGSASNYFESIVAGKNPLQKKFGVAVRMFNIKKYKDSNVSITDEEGIFFYDIQKQDDHYMTCGTDWNLFVATGAADTIKEATDQAYDRIQPDMFTDGYYRPKFDFNSTEYQNSVPNRYDFTKGWLFEAEEWEHDMKVQDMGAQLMQQLEDLLKKENSKALSKQKDSFEKKMADNEEKYRTEIDQLRREIEDALMYE